MKFISLFRKLTPQYLLFIFVLTGATSACKVKEGCPTKDYTNNMDRVKKRGKSNLFSKDMRKRMK